MTHTQLIYLVLVVAAFLVFTGSLMKATISSLSAASSGGDARDRPGGARRPRSPS